MFIFYNSAGVSPIYKRKKAREVTFLAIWEAFWAKSFLRSPPSDGGAERWETVYELHPSHSLDIVLAPVNWKHHFASSQLEFSVCQSGEFTIFPHLTIPVHSTDVTYNIWELKGHFL